VEILKSAWPFQDNISGVFHYDPKTYLQRVAFDYCQKNITWEEAHYRMGKYYSGQQQYDLALKEFNVVGSARPYSYYPHMMRGDVLVLQTRYSEAEQAYQQAIVLKENQFVHVRMGILLVQLQRFDDALKHLEKAFAIDATSSEKFDQDFKLKAMYVRSVAYWAKGDTVSAKQELRQILAIQPNYDQAKRLLDHLQGQYQER
jgi:tetratricopeptide (TPR) repeat protein